MSPLLRIGMTSAHLSRSTRRAIAWLSEPLQMLELAIFSTIAELFISLALLIRLSVADYC